MRKSAIVLFGAALAGCSTTHPGTGVQITYKMPRTDARAAMSIDVTQCESAPNESGLKIADVQVVTTLKVEIVAGASKEYYHVEGRQLASAVIKRGLTIDRDADTGVITGVNAASTDQRSVILANAISFAAKAVAFAATPRGPKGYQLNCTADTKAKVDEIALLKADMVKQRKAMAGAANTKPMVDAMNVDAARIVRLKEELHRDVIGKIEIPDDLYSQRAQETQDHADAGPVLAEGVVKFDWTPLDHFLTSVPFGGAAPIPNPFKDGNTHAENGASDDLRIKVSYRKPDLDVRNGLAWTKASDKAPGDCSLWLKIPSPQPVTLVVTPDGPLYGDTPDEKRAVVQQVVATQLAQPATVCLSAAFGENRTVGLKFDKFGSTTEMAWASDARAANIASSVGGIAGDAFGIATTVRGRALADEKKELDELTTSQSLRAARACQELLDQGATKCE